MLFSQYAGIVTSVTVVSSASFEAGVYFCF
jgi:hypothetical protein